MLFQSKCTWTYINAFIEIQHMLCVPKSHALNIGKSCSGQNVPGQKIQRFHRNPTHVFVYWQTMFDLYYDGKGLSGHTTLTVFIWCKLVMSMSLSYGFNFSSKSGNGFFYPIIIRKMNSMSCQLLNTTFLYLKQEVSHTLGRSPENDCT